MVEASCIKVENVLMPMGFYSLGLVMVGLIVIFSVFQRNEKTAVSILLIILVFLFMPLDVLWVALRVHHKILRFSDIEYGLRIRSSFTIWLLVGMVRFVLMSAAWLTAALSTFSRSEGFRKGGNAA
jgi:hypothetical protein